MMSEKLEQFGVLILGMASLIAMTIGFVVVIASFFGFNVCR